MTLYDLKEFAKNQSCQCRVKARGYEVWLAYLKPFNIVLVTGAAILSLLAGSSLLIDADFLGSIRTGLMALTAGVFTIIHQTLNCDRHQEECKRLRGSYEAIADQFLNLKLEEDKTSIQKKIDELNLQLSFLKENFSARPPLWIVKREENTDRGSL